MKNSKPNFKVYKHLFLTPSQSLSLPYSSLKCHLITILLQSVQDQSIRPWVHANRSFAPASGRSNCKDILLARESNFSLICRRLWVTPHSSNRIGLKIACQWVDNRLVWGMMLWSDRRLTRLEMNKMNKYLGTMRTSRRIQWMWENLFRMMLCMFILNGYLNNITLRNTLWTSLAPVTILRWVQMLSFSNWTIKMTTKTCLCHISTNLMLISTSHSINILNTSHNIILRHYSTNLNLILNLSNNLLTQILHPTNSTSHLWQIKTILFNTLEEAIRQFFIFHQYTTTQY